MNDGFVPRIVFERKKKRFCFTDASNNVKLLFGIAEGVVEHVTNVIEQGDLFCGKIVLRINKKKTEGVLAMIHLKDWRKTQANTRAYY